MRSFSASILVAVLVGASSILMLSGNDVLRSGASHVLAASPAAKITIDYPPEGAVFPPEITPPTLLWRDVNSSAKRWAVEISFKDRSTPIRLDVPGEYMKIGAIDPQAASDDDLVRLSPQQVATRTWTPDSALWNTIKQRSVKAPAAIVISGYVEGTRTPVSTGKVNISTSSDPVGAPVFYRDVPLMLPTREVKGSIQPLPPFAIPLIKWKLRDISQSQSSTVMENLPTCANCHSFSNDGKTFGLDLDGPKNDKGLYALVPVAQHMTIRNQDVIRWSSFLENDAKAAETAVKRFGFMSQVSPEGRFIVTSIGPPGLKRAVKDDPFDFAPGLADRLYSINYHDIHFAQVFYPTRGILAWYDRVEQKLRPLPGADNPEYVHTSAFWSPDGKYLIFSRAKARDSYPAGAPKPEFANDPRETQIQYDLYRIPFNNGKGGMAEPIQGASQNGMSNNFPKVSPDGKWIVFVQNKNGLLMRPDSKLYIVPFQGGKARLMNCNTSRMNSWHTFSPNGRWLAFSSKARSAYTQLMLTHIDENGNDTPAVLVENTTLANRAVNIPEFVNIGSAKIDKIDPQATEFYRLFNQAYDLIENKKWAEAVPVLQQAVQRDPDDPLGHFVLATALSTNHREREAAEEYRKACALDPKNAAWLAHLAVSLANSGDLAGAAENWRKSLEVDPNNPGAEADLGTALFELGNAEEGYRHLKKAIEMAPDFPDAHNHLGWELAKAGRVDEAIPELQKAIDLRPESVEYRANLGYVLAQRGDYPGAIAVFQKAVEVSKGKDWRALDMLAYAYHKSGRNAEAVENEQQALALVVQLGDPQVEKRIRANLERYQGATGASR